MSNFQATVLHSHKHDAHTQYTWTHTHTQTNSQLDIQIQFHRHDGSSSHLKLKFLAHTQLELPPNIQNTLYFMRLHWFSYRNILIHISLTKLKINTVWDVRLWWQWLWRYWQMSHRDCRHLSTKLKVNTCQQTVIITMTVVPYNNQYWK